MHTHVLLAIDEDPTVDTEKQARCVCVCVCDGEELVSSHAKGLCSVET